MHVGRVLGLVLLAAVDAVAAATLAAAVAFFVVPVAFVSTRTALVLVVFAAVWGLVLAVALALASLGQRPFPATRLAKGVYDRVPWWA